MRPFIPRLAWLGIAALPLTSAFADFNPAVVPADAKWVVHIDVAALRQSPVGRDLIARLEKINTPLPNSGGIQLDVKKIVGTLDSATAYGTTFSKKPEEIDGTLIIRGTQELRQIAEAVATQASISSPKEVVEIKDLPFPGYSIKNEITVAFPPEAILVASRSKPQLLKARELMRGKGPSLAENRKSALHALIPHDKNLTLLIASTVPDTAGMFPENAPQTRMLQMTQSASLALSTDEKTTTAYLQLAASDEDTAEKLLKIVQGLTAMASLTQSSNKDVNEFLKSLKSERHDNTIALNLALPNEMVFQMIKDIEANAARASQRRQPVHRPHQAAAIPGKIVATWIADQNTTQPSIGPESLMTRTIENVALKNGTTIILTGQREGGENARWDSVEITQPGGGFPLRFEAENMKLRNYRVEKAAPASGGKVIIITGPSGTARFEFPGTDGTYTLKVRYVDENDGKATFTVSTQDPEAANGDAPAAPESPETPAAPQSPAAPAAPEARTGQ